MAIYNFTKNELYISLLQKQISSSHDIGSDLIGCSWNSDSGELSIEFNGDLSQSEQNALSSIVVSHDSSGGGYYNPIHKRATRSSGKLIKEEWFEACDDQGNLSGLAEDNTYTWQGNVLKSRTYKKYYKCGEVYLQENYEYLSSGVIQIERKVS